MQLSVCTFMFDFEYCQRLNKHISRCIFSFFGLCLVSLFFRSFVVVVEFIIDSSSSSSSSSLSLSPRIGFIRLGIWMIM